MKFTLALLSCLVAVALARPQQNKQDVQILAYSNDVGLNGYNYAYKLSDNSEAQATAELKNAGTDNEALVVRGSYKWVAADGQTYTVTYIADENGFQPQGAHLPTRR